MIREIITYPNRILKQQSVDVVDFDDSLIELLEDMFETMKNRNGIGLAAIQIANLKNIFIINLVDGDGEQKDENKIEYINPKIILSTGSTTYEEGCLSIPGFYAEIKRFDRVEVEYFNRYGEKQNRELNGLEAIAFQHELDHLHGKLFIEKLSFLKRKKFEKEWKKKLKNKK